jgi:hypothetical protein
MQRTGTTSLAKALTALGFNTRDHPMPLFRDRDHPWLEEYDAFTDHPIPLLYQELDLRFPGSKFVHTERDEEAWLESVEWLHSEGAVKFQWDRKPGIAHFHQEFYGTTEFEPEVFRETYRRHNRAVREYFAERPDDLLILDITRGEGFEKLCPFLGREIPAEGFPHWNKQGGVWRERWRKIVKRLRP